MSGPKAAPGGYPLGHHEGTIHLRRQSIGSHNFGNVAAPNRELARHGKSRPGRTRHFYQTAFSASASGRARTENGHDPRAYRQLPGRRRAASTNPAPHGEIRALLHFSRVAHGGCADVVWRRIDAIVDGP